jgi:hypothetical protein
MPTVQPVRRLPTTLPDTPFPDVARLTETLDRHGVDYMVIGGIATRAYGAERPTGDFDCLVRRSVENFDRLAAAMRELNAHLRVGGLSDDEAAGDIILFVDGGYLSCLEYVSYDDPSPTVWPSLDRVEVALVRS